MQNSTTQRYKRIANNNFILSDELLLNTSTVLIIQDTDDNFSYEKKLESHIKSDDYFGTLATVIDLITQENNKIGRRESKVLKKITDDLMYLQENYKIIKK